MTKSHSLMVLFTILLSMSFSYSASDITVEECVDNASRYLESSGQANKINAKCRNLLADPNKHHSHDQVGEISITGIKNILYVDSSKKSKLPGYIAGENSQLTNITSVSVNYLNSTVVVVNDNSSIQTFDVNRPGSAIPLRYFIPKKIDSISFAYIAPELDKIFVIHSGPDIVIFRGQAYDKGRRPSTSAERLATLSHPNMKSPQYVITASSLNEIFVLDNNNIFIFNSSDYTFKVSLNYVVGDVLPYKLSFDNSTNKITIIGENGSLEINR